MMTDKHDEALSQRYVDVADMQAMADRTEHRLACEADPTTFRRFRTLSLNFASTRTYAKPFTDVTLDAEIVAPDGTTYRLPGFYDGGQTWRVRFMPYLAGTYCYRTLCSDDTNTGLNEQSGVFEVGDALPNTALSAHGGHLRAAANGTHLTHTDGTPFFWLADTWWFVPTERMPYDASSHPGAGSMYQLCVALRKKQRFNFVTVGFLGERPQLRNLEDEAREFHGKDDLYQVGAWPDTAVEYWQMVDRYVVYADEAGMGISLNIVWGSDPIHYVKAGLSPGQFLEMLKPVHRYVMARLGSYNIMWHVVAEYNHAEMRELKLTDTCLALGRYLREIDPYRERAMTIFTWPPQLANAEDAWAESWHDVKLTQGGHYGKPWETVSRDEFLRGFATPPRKPYLVGEHNFERIYDKPNDDGDVRAAAWLAMTCGSCGFTYGATGLWYPNRDEQDVVDWHWGNAPWWRALDYPGAGQMTILRAFFERFAWYDMQPITERLMVNLAVEPHYARPSAVLLGGKTAVVYLPGCLDRSVEVRLTLPAGRHRTWFFNPRTGEETKHGEFDLAAAALVLPSRPDDLDWVFVAEALQVSA